MRPTEYSYSLPTLRAVNNHKYADKMVVQVIYSLVNLRGSGECS